MTESGRQRARGRFAALSACVAALTAVAGVALAGAALAAESRGIDVYRAEYEVFFDGRRLAAAEFAVAPDPARGPDAYVFTTTTRARGMLRVLRPGAAEEHSEFRLVDGRIEPDVYRFDDGTRAGDDNFSIAFDRGAGRVEVTTAAGGTSHMLEDGLLDRGSLQVRLMQDLASCNEPEAYRLVDDDGIETYRYERLEDREVGTGLGVLPTHRYLQQREGSSRSTVLWLAPGLSWLPVRIEQMRDGEIETVFALEEVDGLALGESDC